MPIFEYACEDCGTRFEKLVRRTAETSELSCPQCGHDHLVQQYSTFAAHSGGQQAEAPSCASAQSFGGCCGGGMCGMN